MDEDEYWQILAESVEQIEYDYADDCSKESFILSLNIIKNNRTGGRRETVEY